MATDQFSLCWNNFHNNLSAGFHSLLQSEDLVDVTLAAEGRYLKAHKIVLSVCSQYFKELFRDNPCKHPIVILKDVSYNALSDLLQFMYQGEVSVSQDELSTLMKVAETLQIKGLTEDTVNDSSHVNQNGIKNIELVDVKSLAEPTRLGLKRPKLTKKMKQIVPCKIPKPNDNFDGRSLTPDQLNVESEATTNLLVEPDIEPIKPKIEPPEEEPFKSVDIHSEHSLEIDMSSMVDTSMGESSSQSSICWKSENPKPYVTSDPNAPGTFQCVIGKRGVPHLNIDGYIFYKKSTYKTKSFWYCKFNRGYKKCPAVCWTIGTDVVKWPMEHSHAKQDVTMQEF